MFVIYGMTTLKTLKNINQLADAILGKWASYANKLSKNDNFELQNQPKVVSANYGSSAVFGR